ncbi:hypothetical protein [Melghirimyces algeriensis]|uniref:hypothetical protein n=1 Tax=Melghirimyces algeriensis TaxID=910412 RepID=UPI0011596F6D|nr:hypothetical protein [Melghirimyces algeriensis]
MEHTFPTTQRNPWRFQPFSGYCVRWLVPEGMKWTLLSTLPSTSACILREKAFCRMSSFIF